MPQIKIHVSNNIDGLIKGRLAIEVRETMSRHADINDGMLQVMVYESQYRANKDNETNNFILIEVLSSKERTVEEKQWLANLLINKVEQLTNIDSDDITVIYNYMEEVKYFGVVKKVIEKNSTKKNIATNIISYEKDVMQPIKNQEVSKVDIENTIIENCEDNGAPLEENDLTDESIISNIDYYVEKESDNNDTNIKNDEYEAQKNQIEEVNRNNVDGANNSNADTFELLYHSQSGVVNITRTKILNL